MVETLAIDIGAGSGRVYNGSYDGKSIKLKEKYRFNHTPINIEGNTLWDFEHILKSVKRGIQLSTEQIVKIDSLAIDSWAPDYLVFDPSGRRYGHFYSYLDRRTKGVLGKIYQSISAKDIFNITGNSPNEISLFSQLYAHINSDPVIVDKGYKILPLSNALMFLLCGKMSIDFTVTSSSMMFDFRKKDWSDEIFSQFNIRKEIIPPIIECGKKIGSMDESQEHIDVVCPGVHDSALAHYVSKKLKLGDLAISCGTWSIFGVPIDEPITCEKAFDYGFSNVGLPDESYILFKGMKGLWFIQVCKRHWEQQGEQYSYDEISKMAGDVHPARKFIIDLNDASFRNGENLPQKIQAFCAKSHNDYPQNIGEISRCIYESLAFEYKKTINQYETICGKRINSIHLMGGGSKDKLLCQLVADQCELKVIAGPVESTVIGNVLMQLSALGEIDEGEKIQQIIYESEEIKTYIPTV